MFTHFVSVYVPSTQNVGQPLDPEERETLLRNVATKLSQNFGGCTATDGIGYWVSDVAGLIPEKVTIVKSFYGDDTDPEQALSIARFIAREIRVKYGQEAVTVETEKGIEFISD